MNQFEITSTGLLSRPMLAVMSAQFFSAFGDNALLFATLALIKQQQYPEWSQPVLQMLFVAAYIVLAPFVGQFADNFAKGRVMMVANTFKLAGALLVCFGFNPFVGYCLVGIGAAAYSPAKYGILGELTQGGQLVKANGLIEASTIAAILTGSVAGGVLADWHLITALAVCALTYGVAVVANLFIPRLAPARRDSSWHPARMVGHFSKACGQLWHDGYTRFSLIGTSLFWGAGVTLRFLLVLWVPVALGINDNATPTTLNAMVAVGIVFGAAAAARLVTLETVRRCMPAGILMGVVVVALCLQHHLLPSYLLLALIGILGGFFIVPLNALLQQRGKESVGAGNAIAVQNFGENIAMLLMLGLYSLVVRLDVPAVIIGVGFGVLFASAIGLLWLTTRNGKTVR
ncbi:lysophospholipid transporter LplT [Acerihabitans arboris]|uniref:Lysophospholipid transporter LplT n=1 Tax=Acerihabitans arboris TaxID=2691583 RepID=A0A845SQ74_9GAMM|nr:lysophospholipid transporter LplT [Acerihabitans arboris]NDL65512.1 lysophospholipid transporter LplT [Acerihabitans arboris]